jgi:uncharacterized protein (DUF983 family)
MSLLKAIWHQRCPRCREGNIFRGPIWRGVLAMHPRCPVCDLRFEREPGYFMGAMYISYLISIPPAMLISIAIWRLSKLSFNVVMVCAFLAYLPLVAPVTRFARVVWIYVDRHFDP